MTVMPFRSRAVLGWSLGLLAIAAAIGTTILLHRPAATASPAPLPPVERSAYAAVAAGKVDVEGGIIPIAARTAGVVQAVFVEEGQDVVAGQRLAQLDDAQARTAFASAEAARVEAEARVVLLEAQFTAARREAARLEPLVARGFAAAQRGDEIRDRVQQAQAAVAAAQASVGTAKAKAAEARELLELAVIRAPVDGRVIRRLASPGAGASSLNVSIMFELAPRAPRIVRAELPEAAVRQIDVGQAVEIVSETESAPPHASKVLRIAPVFGARRLASDDPAQPIDEQVVEVVVSVDEAAFRIGQHVLVRFIGPASGRGVGPA
jgi:HlyD family secretion protein